MELISLFEPLVVDKAAMMEDNFINIFLQNLREKRV